MSRALKTAKKSAVRKQPRAAARREAGARSDSRAPSKPNAAAGARERADGPASKGPRTLGELMTHALTMETDAAQRYAELADAMDTHNNREVAKLFRKMAHIESQHAAQIMAAMAWKEAPTPGALPWEGFEAPETTPGDEVHYLMQPYHALQLALVNEQRAERFFAHLARVATVESVRKAARQMQAEEREHVALVRAWLKKTPKPDRYWAHDPDPARYTD
jgi:rubrerythrin